MKYILIISFILFGCQKEIKWPEEQTERPKANNCKYLIIDKFKYTMSGGELRGAFQLGGTYGSGWYLHETSTYFVIVHDTIWNMYSKGDFLPINPN